MKPKNCVLIADDNEDDAFLMQRALQQSDKNACVYIVRNETEIFDYLRGTGSFTDRRQFPFPYLMILDLKFPGKDGLDVLYSIKNDDVLRVLPIIVYTSVADPNIVAKSYRLGANAFVQKPASYEKQKEVFKLISDFWLHLNAQPEPLI